MRSRNVNKIKKEKNHVRDSGIFQLRNNGHGGGCLRIKGYATAVRSSMFQNLGKPENNRYLSKAKFGRIACTNLQIMPRTIYLYTLNTNYEN